MEEAAAKSIANVSGTTATSRPSADNKTSNLDFDSSLTEEERRFYVKAYPNIDLVRERKVHCTVCKVHIGTAPIQENVIRMHPVLRVTHCLKCHDFYNSGEFSKGEDGSELYCRWCGQGGEVYCCSSCPYVFCKSCIVKNLSRGVVADIEQNENWSCFSCAPKILWPLRAQHWALINYIEQQKKAINAQNLPEAELKQQLSKDHSSCCRLAKSKCGNMSDSMESLESVASRRSHGSSAGSAKKTLKQISTPTQSPAAKRAKSSNDEVVCTPDLMSMLEPDCEITVSPKPRSLQTPAASTPKVMSIQTGFGGGGVNSSTKSQAVPPPLVLRNTGIKLRPVVPAPVVRRTVVGPRTPTPVGSGTPVYHTINGYRIDLNSAAQQETFRLPNGKLIQVKRQGTQPSPTAQTHNSGSGGGSGGAGAGGGGGGGGGAVAGNWQQLQQHRVVPPPVQGNRPIQITQTPFQTVSIQQQQQQQQQQHQHHQQQQQQQQHQQTAQQHPQMIRYHNAMVGNTTLTSIGQNGTQIQVINGAPPAPVQSQMPPGATLRPLMVRHIFPDTPIGQARSQLQDQVFNAMEICTHLTGKVQTLTNSNAYKQARNYLEVKELYIHLSYLLTYAIGRFKGLQDKCLADMRQLGFVNDADCLENGQLAAGVDYVCYGQLDDVDLFNTGSNSFHNQVYEYRKSLHANLKDGEEGNKSPLPPLFPLRPSVDDGDGDGDGDGADDGNDEDEGEDEGEGNGDGGSEGRAADSEELLDEAKDIKGHWLAGGDDSRSQFDNIQEGDEPDYDEPDESYFDDEECFNGVGGGYGAMRGTEEAMRRNEESHAYDRKLTRLIEQYPSIWCTRHPDYGNFEVTRKQWRTIAAHFKRNDNIKLRWKNIRKRFVRIERRIAEGKRFNGYFDKATNFLANRDLPEDQWREVDRGEDDGDTFDRKQLDAVERSLERRQQQEADGGVRESEERRSMNFYQQPVRPIDISSIDVRIINFVKSNPVLWRKSMDLEADRIDEQTRKSLWMHLWKSMPHLNCDDIIDRWQHLYEMYKTFRLKTIKSPNARSLLELKYSKYLAKLYFLYKIDEQELRNENNLLFEDYFECDDGDEEDDETYEPEVKLQDLPDDKEFLLQLVRTVRQHPALWKPTHIDYNDLVLRDSLWRRIGERLQHFQRDLKSIKLRWQLAKYSYYRLRRERLTLSEYTALPKFCRNLPAEEMSFLDN